MSITKLALKFAAPLPDIMSFNRYLFIGPHPDDIEIGAGATAARLAAEGKEICFLICTDGRYGDVLAPQGLSAEELVSLRKAEALHSAELLGVKSVRFLGLSDGGFYEKEALLSGIAVATGEFQPDVIFAPDPAVSSECHPDHLNVGRAAGEIGYFSPYAGIMRAHNAEAGAVKAIAYYMTAKPDYYVKTTKYLKIQSNALFDCHQSQFPAGSDDAAAIAKYLWLRSLDFGLRSFKGRAEGFRVLDGLHMHCMPEAEK